MSGRLQIADAPALAGATRRTQATRLLLGLALTGLLATAALTAAKGGAPPAKAAVARKNLEIVLDLSGSVTSDEGGVAGDALRKLQLEARGGTVGLVLFSDSAEETLPPGSPPAELDPYIRYFSDPTEPPRTPWSNGFSAGTAISTGVAVARQALRRDHLGGRVMIVSDLGEANGDRPALATELRALKAMLGVTIQIRPVPVTNPPGLLFVRRILGSRAISTPPEHPLLLDRARPAAFPLTLVVLAALVALGIALNELVAVSLRWRTA